MKINEIVQEGLNDNFVLSKSAKKKKKVQNQKYIRTPRPRVSVKG